MKLISSLDVAIFDTQSGSRATSDKLRVLLGDAGKLYVSRVRVVTYGKLRVTWCNIYCKCRQ